MDGVPSRHRRRTSRRGLGFVLGFGLLTSTLAAEESEILLRAARNAVAVGEHERALQRFERFLEVRPDRTDVLIEYAGVLESQGRSEDSERVYRSAREQDPRNEEVRRGLARVLLRGSERREAAELLDGLLADAIGPPPAALALETALAWAAVGEIERARRIERSRLRERELSADQEDRLAGLRLQLGDEARARPLVEARLRERPSFAAVVQAVWLELAADRPQQAQLHLVRGAEVEAEATAARLLFARELMEARQSELAHTALRQVLDVEPSSIEARVLSVEIALRDLELVTAEAALARLLDDPDAASTMEVRHLAARVDLRCGRWGSALRRLEGLILEDPEDTALRADLAELWARIGDPWRQRAELEKAVALRPLSVPLRLELARWNIGRRRFDDARAILRQLELEDATRVELRRERARAEHGAGETARAIAMLRETRRRGLVSEADRQGVAVDLAELLMEQGELREALDLFEEVVEASRGRNPFAVVGRARCQQRLDLPVDDELPVGLERLSVEQCHGWAAAELRHGERSRARAWYQRALERCPQNLPTLLALATLRADEEEGDADVAIELHRRILDRGANLQSRLALAALCSRQRRYDEALEHSVVALAHVPRSSETARARARLLEWAGRPAESQRAFRELEASLREDRSRESDPALARHDRRAADEARRSVSLERQAREQRSAGRMDGAIERLELLVEHEPGNLDARLLLGQSYDEARRGREARQTYQDILGLDSSHRPARRALLRQDQQRRPAVDAELSLEHREGRDRLVDVETRRLRGEASWPIHDEAGEFASVALQRSHYHTGDEGRDFVGHRAAVRAELRPFDPRELSRVNVFGELWAETLSDGLDTRWGGEVGLELPVHEATWLRARLFQDVASDNTETFREGTLRRGLGVSAWHRFHRRLRLDGGALFSAWNDDNRSIEADLRGTLNLSFAPRELQLIGEYRYSDFEEQTAFDPANPPASFLGVDFPYFSPSSYSTFGLGLVWRHFLGEDIGADAPRFYYELQGGLRWDSLSQQYQHLRGALVHDVFESFSANLAVEFLRGDFYDETRFLLGAQARF